MFKKLPIRKKETVEQRQRKIKKSRGFTVHEI